MCSFKTSGRLGRNSVCLLLDLCDALQLLNYLPEGPLIGVLAVQELGMI